MYKTADAVVKLTRIYEYYGSCVLLTLLGTFAAGTNNTLKPLLAVTANLMSFAFAFMINDIEDAEDDALDPKKAKRNPVSAGKISKRSAYAAALTVAVLCLVTYASINIYAFLLGTIGIVLGFLYSWKRVRLKSLPIVDIISHALFLAALGFLVGVSTNTQTSNFVLIAWVGISLFIFSMFEDLRNELRDYEVDFLSKLKNTAQIFKLNRFEKIIKRISVIPLLSIVAYLALQTTTTSKLLIAIGALALTAHYAIFYKSKNKSIFDYPLIQIGFVLIGSVLLFQSINQ